MYLKRMSTTCSRQGYSLRTCVTQDPTKSQVAAVSRVSFSASGRQNGPPNLPLIYIKQGSKRASAHPLIGGRSRESSQEKRVT
jgi:hypothetical protein